MLAVFLFLIVQSSLSINGLREIVSNHSNIGSSINSSADKDELKRHYSRQQRISFPFQERVEEQFRDAGLVNNGESLFIGTHHDADRSLQRDQASGNFESIRITFVTDEIEQLREQSDWRVKNTIKFLLEEVLPTANTFYSHLLSVRPLTGPMVIESDTCFDEVEVPSRILKNGVDDTDLVIFVKGETCAGPGAIAAASPCSLTRAGDNRPIVGIIWYCLDSEVLLNRDAAAVEVTLHELTHVLGMNSGLMPYFVDPETRLPYVSEQNYAWTTCVNGRARRVLRPSTEVLRSRVTSRGVSYFEVVTPTVKQVVRNQFDCQTLTGARLENQPTASQDCFGSHWDERYFHTESMGAYYGTEQNALSSLTLAVLEDSGWYAGNYSHVTKSTFGHGAGCAFVEEDCIVNGLDVPDYSRGFFCNTVESMNRFNYGGFTSTCTVTHSGIGFCDLFDFGLESINKLRLPPSRFLYFENTELAPYFFTRADFCPIPIHRPLEDCRTGEGGSADRLCVNQKLGTGEYAYQSAECVNFECNERIRRLLVIFESETITCDYDFQEHTFPGSVGVSFECPRAAVVCPDWFCPANCSGRGVCSYGDGEGKCDCFDESDSSPGCYGAFSDWWVVPTFEPSARPTSSRQPMSVPSAQPNNKPTATTLKESDQQISDMRTLSSSASGIAFQGLGIAFFLVFCPVIAVMSTELV